MQLSLKDSKRSHDVICLSISRYTEDEVEEQVSTLREELKKEGYQSGLQGAGGDSHQIAEAQQRKHQQLRAAFGIREDYVEGSSFNAGQIKATLAKAAREKEAE